MPGQWQTWDTMSGGAWYSSASGSSTYRPIVGGVAQPNPPCTQSSYCTWSTLMTDYPNARIRPTISGAPGLFLIRAGGPVTGGFVGATDNVVVGIGSNVTNNNFEPGDGNVVVNASNAASLGFGFVQETPNGSGAFVSGPNGSDGAGSAQLTVDATGGEALANGLYAGTRFDHINFLSYKTYQAAVGPNATTLQFDVDYDATDSNTSYQGRLVFEPSLSGQAAVTSETWQTWNPMTAPSGWWQTGTPIVGGVPVAQACTQAAPCSFAHLLATYPNAAIRPITGQIRRAADRRRDLAQGWRWLVARLHRQRRLADHRIDRRWRQRHRDVRLRALDAPGAGARRSIDQFDRRRVDARHDAIGVAAKPSQLLRRQHIDHEGTHMCEMPRRGLGERSETLLR